MTTSAPARARSSGGASSPAPGWPARTRCSATGPTPSVARRRLRPVRPAQRLPTGPGHPRPLPAAARVPRAVGRDLPPGDARGRRSRRHRSAALLEAVCAELDRRGITAVEAYPEGRADPWLPSPDRHRSTRPPASSGPPATTSSRSTAASWPARPMSDAWYGPAAPRRRRRTRATPGRCRCRPSAERGRPLPPAAREAKAAEPVRRRLTDAGGPTRPAVSSAACALLIGAASRGDLGPTFASPAGWWRS